MVKLCNNGNLSSTCNKNNLKTALQANGWSYNDVSLLTKWVRDADYYAYFQTREPLDDKASADQMFQELGWVLDNIQDAPIKKLIENEIGRALTDYDLPSQFDGSGASGGGFMPESDEREYDPDVLF